MRSRRGRKYRSYFAGTILPNTVPLGITGDFEGGIVTVTAMVQGVVGAGGWATIQVLVDGVAGQTVNPGTYQSGANTYVGFSQLMRIPRGRHRLGLMIGMAGASMTGAIAEIQATEL